MFKEINEATEMLRSHFEVGTKDSPSGPVSRVLLSVEDRNANTLLSLKPLASSAYNNPTYYERHTHSHSSDPTPHPLE